MVEEMKNSVEGLVDKAEDTFQNIEHLDKEVEDKKKRKFKNPPWKANT